MKERPRTSELADVEIHLSHVSILVAGSCRIDLDEERGRISLEA